MSSLRKTALGEPRIIVRLKGGLGNQMFMYALAKSLSLKNDVPLRLDIVSGFSRDRTYKRKYLLHHFFIDDEIASDWESFHHVFGRKRRKFAIRYNNLLPLSKRAYVKERSRGFDDNLFELPVKKTRYLEGYRQSYKYFEWIENVIRERFSFRFSLTEEGIEEARSIESCNAVCLAIRRFQDVPAERIHKKSILGPDYYKQAVGIIEDKVYMPHFFVFTQDSDWAKQNLGYRNNMTFIRKKDPDIGAVIDLRLMTLCKHYIISNSTLHWWGAWLNADPGKIVIAPQDGWGRKDMLPPAWTAIDYNYDCNHI